MVNNFIVYDDGCLLVIFVKFGLDYIMMYCILLIIKEYGIFIVIFLFYYYIYQDEYFCVQFGKGYFY